MSFFFFNDTATTEIYTLSLHDALPISVGAARRQQSRSPDGGQRRARVARHLRPARRLRPRRGGARGNHFRGPALQAEDRKSTRLNSSHSQISYAVFCLKKKKRPYDR